MTQHPEQPEYPAEVAHQGGASSRWENAPPAGFAGAPLPSESATPPGAVPPAAAAPYGGYAPPPPAPHPEAAPTDGPQLRRSSDASSALTLAIISFFCFGIILGPIAIAKGLRARREIDADPGFTGWGKANAAVFLGISSLGLWALELIARVAG